MKQSDKGGRAVKARPPFFRLPPPLWRRAGFAPDTCRIRAVSLSPRPGIAGTQPDRPPFFHVLSV